MTPEMRAQLVEAMARADHERTRAVALKYDVPYLAWEDLEPAEREIITDAAEVALAAAEAWRPPCPTCGGTGHDRTKPIPSVFHCPACGGSGVSGVRLALVEQVALRHVFADGTDWIERGPDYFKHGEMAAVKFEPVFREVSQEPAVSDQGGTE